MVSGAISDSEEHLPTGSTTRISSGSVAEAPSPRDYFGFFGLPRKLNLDLAALEREFHRLSRKLHPDLFARASQQEQQWATEQSSQLNDAYRTLRDPIARTQYLLQLEGVQLEEQSKAATERARQTGEAKQQAVPADMLEEVFELNMQLEEMRAGKKLGERDETVVRDLEQARRNFEARLNALSDELQDYWKEWDMLVARHGSDAAAIPEAERKAVRDRMVDLLNRRSYMRNLVRDVNAALAD